MFWLSRMGVKFTVPRLKSYLKSWIVRLIAWMSVVPHQLYVAFTFNWLFTKSTLF